MNAQESTPDDFAAYRAAVPVCSNHGPPGARSGCVICAGIQLQAALSEISYLLGPPNEMRVGEYSLHHDEQAVVEAVRKRLAPRPTPPTFQLVSDEAWAQWSANEPDCSVSHEQLEQEMHTERLALRTRAEIEALEQRAERAEAERDTIAGLNHDQFLELTYLRRIHGAAHDLYTESEEYDFDDGLGRGAAQELWDALADSFDPETEAIEGVVVKPVIEQERDALTARLAAAEADAELWRHFRQLVKDDTVRAQAIVWNADKSRTKFTYAVKQSIAFAKRAASNAAIAQETKNGQG